MQRLCFAQEERSFTHPCWVTVERRLEFARINPQTATGLPGAPPRTGRIGAAWNR
jgi:hypothetical protein